MSESATTVAGSTEPRWFSWVAWTALAGYGLLCIGPWTETAWRAEWDSALYLETARSLAAGDGYAYLGEPFFLRPPGLPWLLSFFVRDGALPEEGLNRLMMLFAAGVVTGIFLMLRQHHGTLPALCVALLTGTNPLFVEQFNTILSDFPYALLLFLSIPLFHAGLPKNRETRWRNLLLATSCLTAAIYVRTQAVLLLPGLLFLAYSRGQGKRALLPLTFVLSLTAPWFLRARALAHEAPVPARQFMLHDYATALFHVDPSDPGSPRMSLGGWWERIEQNAAALGESVAESLGLQATGTWPTCTAILAAVLVLFGFVRVVRAGRLGWGLFEWFALVNLMLLLIYFTFAPRLAVPLVPALYLYPLTLMRGLRGRIGDGLCVLAVTGLLLLNVSHLAENRQASRLVRTRTTVARSIGRWLRANTPEDAVILAKQGPIITHLSGRRTYSYSFDKNPSLLRELAIDYAVFFGRGAERLERAALSSGGERWEIPAPMRTLVYRIPRP